MPPSNQSDQPAEARPRDRFPWDERPPQRSLLWAWSIVGVLVVAGIFLFRESRQSAAPGDGVILYAAQDQIYAEPILTEFERQTGIRVKAVYDSEAVKTVGLANRLLAEKDRPQCDVFWGNEELRTRQLAARGVFRQTNGWTAFGYRSRRLAVLADHPGTKTPDSLQALTNSAHRGKVALAYPLFGTTATHFLALRQHWGKSNWLNWCRALAVNQPFIVDGNSVAVRFLQRGDAEIAVTDSDDISAAVREGARLRALPMDPETLLIPNTVAIIRNCRHPEAAQRLSDYLRSRPVTDQLIAAGALEGADPATIPTPTLRPDWDSLLADLDGATEELKEVFRR